MSEAEESDVSWRQDWALDPDRALPFTEPEVIHEFALNGLTVRRYDNGFRLVGWTTVLGGNGEPEERRIMVRFAISERGARQLRADIGKLFGTEH